MKPHSMNHKDQKQNGRSALLVCYKKTNIYGSVYGSFYLFCSTGLGNRAFNPVMLGHSPSGGNMKLTVMYCLN